MTVKQKLILAMTVLIGMIILLFLQGDTSIDGVVVDAETGKPIEGAMVLGWWTISGGPVEMLSGHTYDIKKATTDQNGKFHLSVIILNPFVNEPYLTVYKAGYVCWKSRYIFPENKHRFYQWGSGQTYMLEKFKPEYNYTDHIGFITSALPFLDARDSFSKAYEWEYQKSRQELNEKYRKEDEMRKNKLEGKE